MGLKKINAVTALLSVVTLALHVGYNTFAYLTFYYDPVMKVLTAIPFIVCVCIHAVLGMCSLFLLGDGTRTTDYSGINRRTVLQRVSAALIFPLLIIHLDTYDHLKQMAESGSYVLFWLIVVVQVLFYLVIAVHTATSFSNAFITLGWLGSMDTKKKIDRVICVLLALAFIFSTFAVVRTEIIMFLM